MRKPVILRTDAELNMGESLAGELADIATLVTAPNDEPDTLAEMATDADLIFTCYAPITSAVINAGTKLQGIVKYGVGVDSIDLDAASARGIPVVHCPDYGTETVADQAFALMIAVARKLSKVDAEMHTRGWLWPESAYRGVDLAGKTLGLIGYGRIGKAMARRGAGFGMRRLVCDPYVPHDDLSATLTFTSLDKVVEQADFLSLHCVLTPETHEILDADAISRLKSSAIVVNVSRGALIDERALVSALRKGTIAGAGLDVFRAEPLAPGHPLLALDNVVLSPHFAFYTDEAHHRLEQECLRAIRALLTGETPRNIRNAESLATNRGRPAGQTQAVRRDQHIERLNPPADVELDRSEGDINRSPHRRRWHEEHTDRSTRDLLERDASHFVHQSLSTPCLTSLSGCEGIYLIDESGHKYMDFHGNSAHQIGYAHPRVIEAIKRQLDELSFCPRRFTNRAAIDLAEKLAACSPGRLNKVLFAPAGTSAVGIAMKLARYVTGRHKTISMWDTFHGASLDAISIGGEALFRDGLGPLLPGAFHVPWPRDDDDASAIERLMSREGDIGAVIAEPLRCTTIERPSDSYWHQVRQLCDQHGALLIFDEIPLALGRTGKLFCCEHSGVVPDVLVIGKGLGGGVMPLAAAIIRDELDCVADRSLGHYTHEKSPVGAAAGLATLQVIEEEDLLRRSTELGAYALARLRDLQRQQTLIGEVRGLGLALAIELRRDGRPACDEAERALYACLSRGVSFKVSSGNVLTLTPPLTITQQQLDAALSIIADALAAVQPATSAKKR